MMETSRDVVITGVGVASPIGIGTDPFWHALLAGESGIRPIDLFDSSGLSVRFGGQIAGFDPKLYVRPRKSLKVMSREIQLGFAAADLAIALAVASAARGTPLPGTTAAMGEIGLTGAVRPVGHAGRRLAVCAAHQVGRVVSGPVGDATATAGAHLLLRNEVPDAIRAAFAGNGA